MNSQLIIIIIFFITDNAAQPVTQDSNERQSFARADKLPNTNGVKLLRIQSGTPGRHPVNTHQMAPPKRGSTHLITALLLIYRPQKDERLSCPSWLTCSRQFTHISGHPLATGQAQDRETLPAKDYCNQVSWILMLTDGKHLMSSWTSHLCYANTWQQLATQLWDKVNEHIVMYYLPEFVCCNAM